MSADATCRQALVLALDVSSSIDEDEYAIQNEGLASALLDEDVQFALIGPKAAQVALAVFEWSGQTQQTLVQDWILLDNVAQLETLAAKLRRGNRSGGTHPTAIGMAIGYAQALFDRGPECFKRTLDISGDGKNNQGPRPEKMRGLLVHDDVTVNGLVIAGTEVGDLWAYYSRQVIFGDTAFVEVAAGFEDYGVAMKRKLLREVPLAFVKAY